MGYTDILILVCSVTLCLITNSLCCDEETVVTCQRKNMTCLRSLCTCNSVYRTHVTCANVTEVPKEFPNEVFAIVLHYNPITVIEKRAFANLPNLKSIDLIGNQITVIEKDAFVSLPSLDTILLNDNNIRIIDTDSFVNMAAKSPVSLHLENNNLTRITANMFRDILLSNIFFDGNPITVIEKHAFVNLPLLHLILGIQPFLKKIETEAFVNLSTTALGMAINENNDTDIEKNAFMNVHFNLLHSSALIIYLFVVSLVISSFTVLLSHDTANLYTEPLSTNPPRISQYFKALGQNCVMKENRLITISDSIYINDQNLMCDCDVMWFVYVRHDKPFRTQGGKCSKNNKTLSELVPQDFDCIDNVASIRSCNVSQSVDLSCEYNYLTTNLTRWIHSRSGILIREMNIDFVDKDTNTLHFSFCDHDDSGEYTCMLETDYSLLPSINISVHLIVNGLPVVLNRHTEEKGDDLILSVMFYSIPYDFIIEWLQGPDNLNEDPQYSILVNNMTVKLKQYNVDVTTDGFISNLTIHNFRRRPSDVYSCRISNVYEEVVEQFILGPATLELERRAYCDTSNSIELNCTLQLVGATPVSWIHSIAGETIRSLQGRHVNTSNILTIPFCNSQDTGDYTCRWKTDILGQTIMEKSTTLSVSGPPFFISQFTTVDGGDTVFSVTFFSKPYPNDPRWYFNNEPVALGAKFQQTTSYTIVQIRQHRVLVNVEGFISNLTVHKAEYGLYKCVILNSFGEVKHLFVIKQEHNTFSISTTEATTSSETTENSVTVIITISSSVVGVVIVVFCIIIFIRRILPKTSDRYNSTMPTRNEDSTYDTIRMSTLSKMPDDQADYSEVL